MPQLFRNYLAWLLATNHSATTARNARTALRRFLKWLRQAHPSLTLPRLAFRHVEEYQRALSLERRPNGLQLAWSTQAEYLGALQGAFRWARRRRLLPRDPAAALTLPKRPFRLPRAVLTAREAERVLRQAAPGTALGLRDRALLEVLYSTGLRRAELAALRLEDIDLGRRLLVVRAGKGQRDRYVPLGRRPEKWLGRYLRRARGALLGSAADQGWVFISSRGTRLALNRLSERVRGYVKRGARGKTGSCHLFRHTMATLVLEGGADVRVVQELLGHASLSTTARYTHIAYTRLIRSYAAAHPAEREERRRARRRGRQRGRGRPSSGRRGS